MTILVILLALDNEFGNILASLAVIYGPNEDNPGFYNILTYQ